MTTVLKFDQADAVGATNGHILGGGTLLMRQVNYAPQTVETLIRVTDPALRQITNQGDRILIGAGVTMSEIIASRDLEALAKCARGVGGPAIRNMATIGGNLFAPAPYGDFTAALLAVGAEIHWAGGRREDMETFLSHRANSAGMVTGVSVPRLRSNEVLFRKVSRVKPKGVSVLSITALLRTSGQRVEEARIAFGAMGPVPLRAKAAENALQGKALVAASVQDACRVCTQDLQPMTDALASEWYRREVAPVHLRRLLLGEE